MKYAAKFLAILAVIAVASTAFAVEGGNPRKGKYLYKKSCKTCHVEGAEGGELVPMTKTQSQWKRFFDRDKHKDNPEAWKGLSEGDLLDIHQYLHDHAADSDQPETCG